MWAVVFAERGREIVQTQFFFHLALQEPGEGSADEGEGLAGAGGALEDAELARLQAPEDARHELGLDVVGREGEPELGRRLQPLLRLARLRGHRHHRVTLSSQTLRDSISI